MPTEGGRPKPLLAMVGGRLDQCSLLGSRVVPLCLCSLRDDIGT
jgi:hypothetical protein